MSNILGNDQFTLLFKSKKTFQPDDTKKASSLFINIQSENLPHDLIDGFPSREILINAFAYFEDLNPEPGCILSLVGFSVKGFFTKVADGVYNNNEVKTLGNFNKKCPLSFKIFKDGLVLEVSDLSNCEGINISDTYALETILLCDSVREYSSNDWQNFLSRYERFLLNTVDAWEQNSPYFPAEIRERADAVWSEALETYAEKYLNSHNVRKFQ